MNPIISNIIHFFEGGGSQHPQAQAAKELPAPTMAQQRPMPTVAPPQMGQRTLQQQPTMPANYGSMPGLTVLGHGQPSAQPGGFQNDLANVFHSVSGLGQGAQDVVHQFASFFNRPESQPQQQGQQPTPTQMPGQAAWVQMMQKQNPAQNAAYYNNLYRQAATAPGGHYYNPNPTSAPQPSPTGVPTRGPAPMQVTNTPLPKGLSQSMNYLSTIVPRGTTPQDYFPALKDPTFMAGVQAADQAKPGLGNVLLLQALHESSLGRAQNGNNLFGALPGGEGSGRAASFPNYAAALQYQLGPNVLGGGGNKNMNIMNEPGPLTASRLQQLYQSYNPEGSYINNMLQVLQ